MSARFRSPYLLIFDSHPVQYKAPVYQELERLRPGDSKVVYASDCSVKGHRDRDFGQVIAWDTPLLEGYDFLVLNNQRGVPLRGFRSLRGRGIFNLLRKEAPGAVLISQFLYESDIVTYLSCLLLGIPVWIRHETQDEAFSRSIWKLALRTFFYRVAYAFVSHAFYIGQLSREHLLRHGISPKRMSFAPYCVSNPVSACTDFEKQRRRAALRHKLHVDPRETLLLFSGKLIEKKNPRLLVEALRLLSGSEPNPFKLLFVGSGVLEQPLREMSEKLGERVSFAGFINQSEMADYYLAADILILPSRQAGETWGLVVNEALHAGCSVVVTNAVGCYREFGKWDRVRVIPDGDAGACANAIRSLMKFERSFNWCAPQMEAYSVPAAATALATAIHEVR